MATLSVWRFDSPQGAVVDKVREAFANQPAELVRTNLSNDEEQRLRAIFAE